MEEKDIIQLKIENATLKKSNIEMAVQLLQHQHIEATKQIEELKKSLEENT